MRPAEVHAVDADTGEACLCRVSRANLLAHGGWMLFVEQLLFSLLMRVHENSFMRHENFCIYIF